MAPEINVKKNDRASAKLDAEVAAAVARYSALTGEGQQHALSVAAFLYLAMPPETRAIASVSYAQWLAGGAMGFTVDITKANAKEITEAAATGMQFDRMKELRSAIEGSLSRDEFAQMIREDEKKPKRGGR